MQINKIIEAEAERLWNEQWQESAQEYAHEETKTYKPETKDMCFYERVFGFERGVQVGFSQGANFALSLPSNDWIEIKEGCEMPEENPENEYEDCRDGRQRRSDWVLLIRGKYLGLGYYDYTNNKWYSQIDKPTHYQLINLPQPPKNK